MNDDELGVDLVVMTHFVAQDLDSTTNAVESTFKELRNVFSIVRDKVRFALIAYKDQRCHLFTGLIGDPNGNRQDCRSSGKRKSTAFVN